MGVVRIPVVGVLGPDHLVVLHQLAHAERAVVDAQLPVLAPLVPGAESVDVSEDETVYTYHLRKDAKWSDGQPVTAHDYEYGWKRLENPEYGYSYASFLYNVVGAEEYNKGTGSADDMKAVALDDYTFEVTLKVPDPTCRPG